MTQTPTQSPLDAKGLAKFQLWFFRDISDEQRLSLFSIFGMPVDEIGKVHGHQRHALNHVLRAYIASQEAAAPSEEPVANAIAWLLGCLHHANPTDDSQWHVRPGRHSEFSKAVWAIVSASPAVAPVAVSETDRLVRASQWLQERWSQKHPNTALIRQLADYEAFLSSIIPATKGGEVVEALRRAERKLTAYVGVCKGDKELTETVLPMVRAALSQGTDTEVKP